MISENDETLQLRKLQADQESQAALNRYTTIYTAWNGWLRDYGNLMEDFPKTACREEARR